jgi:hypothetical protein
MSHQGLGEFEEKAYVSSWMSDPSPARGGKPRRYFKIERAGAQALRDAREAADQMWRGVDPATLRTR